jgi:hypothetical protein
MPSASAWCTWIETGMMHRSLEDSVIFPKVILGVESSVARFLTCEMAVKSNHGKTENLIRSCPEYRSRSFLFFARSNSRRAAACVQPGRNGAHSREPYPVRGSVRGMTDAGRIECGDDYAQCTIFPGDVVGS